MSKILSDLEAKKIKPPAAYEQVKKNFKLIPEIIEGLKAERPQVKYGCGKVLRMLSDERPGKLYPYWSIFTKMLDSENNIMKWEGIYVLGNLATVDKDKKFEEVFNKYLGMMDQGKLITAANVVGKLPVVAKAKPQLLKKIVTKLLDTENIKLETNECKNVLLGHVIEAFTNFYDVIQENDRRKVRKFLKKRLRCRRKAVKKKAEIFLKKLDDKKVE